MNFASLFAVTVKTALLMSALVVVVVLGQLLEARVQVADVGNRVDDPFAVQLEHDAQRRVRRRVLRAEVERPEIILFGRRCGE